jgi:hypothetical protein
MGFLAVTAGIIPATRTQTTWTTVISKPGCYTTTVVHEPDGSRDYFVNGHSMGRNPPPGFNSLTASQADLNKYGFPPRPQPGDGAYKLWVQGEAVPNHTYVDPIVCPDTTGRH